MVGPWILALRPKTLIATVAPIALGATIAFDDGVFVLSSFMVALLSALFIQVGTNIANDYYDFVKGADNADRVGPQRVTQSGLLAPKHVQLGFIFCFCIAALLGLYLVYDAGLVIMWVGLASIVSGVAYTAGPWPLAYVGLGEVFVLIFFGPVASGFTYFVMAHEMSETAFVVGLCPGVLSCAILVANNLRDVDQDTKSNKRTLVVRFGKTFAKIEYAMAWIFAYGVVAYLALSFEAPTVLLPLATLPMAIYLCRQVIRNHNPRDLIKVLEGTAKTMAVFTMLFCLGILL